MSITETTSLGVQLCIYLNGHLIRICVPAGVDVIPVIYGCNQIIIGLLRYDC